MAKRQVRTDEIEQKILAMYVKGMSQRDIEDNLRGIYGVEIPQTLISKITDKTLPQVNEWQNRPLDAIYPIAYFDGIVFKSRKDSQIINKCIYTVLGIDVCQVYICSWGRCPRVCHNNNIIKLNAEFHRKTQIYDIVDEYGFRVMFLPAYSPDLNSIEKFWATMLKNRLRVYMHKFDTFWDALAHAFK